MARKASPSRSGKWRGSRPKLALSVQYACDAARLPTRSEFRRWVGAALAQDAEVAIRIVGEEEGRQLNRDYRGRDYATNVLTFAYHDTAPLSGDIVLTAPVVAREAEAQGKSLKAHYAHLTVHGVLHLQGYDHEKAEEARIMEARESEIVTRLGYDDPYGIAKGRA